MTKRTFIIQTQPFQNRPSLMQYVNNCRDGIAVTFDDDPTRTLSQNAAQWPILQAFSEQLLWPVNGKMVKMSDEEWKDVLTAAFKNETMRIAEGLNGGVVMLGLRTSRFGKREFSEWLEYLNAIAAFRGVNV